MELVVVNLSGLPSVGVCRLSTRAFYVMINYMYLGKDIKLQSEMSALMHALSPCTYMYKKQLWEYTQSIFILDLQVDISKHPSEDISM